MRGECSGGGLGEQLTKALNPLTGDVKVSNADAVEALTGINPSMVEKAGKLFDANAQQTAATPTRY